MQALIEILACGGVPDWTADLLCSYLSNPRISLENPGPCISDEMDVIVVVTQGTLPYVSCISRIICVTHFRCFQFSKTRPKLNMSASSCNDPEMANCRIGIISSEILLLSKANLVKRLAIIFSRSFQRMDNSARGRRAPKKPCGSIRLKKSLHRILDRAREKDGWKSDNLTLDEVGVRCLLRFRHFASIADMTAARNFVGSTLDQEAS